MLFTFCQHFFIVYGGYAYIFCDVWYTRLMKSLHLSRPHAIMMVGYPGSGKSFFAERFADMFNAPYIDALTLTSYAKDVPSAMKIITSFAAEVAKTGNTFVYEGDTDTRELRSEFVKWSKSYGFEPLIVWVQVEKDSAKIRSLKKNTLTSAAFDDVVAKFQAPTDAERAIVISGKHTYASQAKTVLSYLSKSGRLVTKPVTVPDRPATPQIVRSISIR